MVNIRSSSRRDALRSGEAAPAVRVERLAERRLADQRPVCQFFLTVLEPIFEEATRAGGVMVALAALFQLVGIARNHVDPSSMGILAAPPSRPRRHRSASVEQFDGVARHRLVRLHSDPIAAAVRAVKRDVDGSRNAGLRLGVRIPTGK